MVNLAALKERVCRAIDAHRDEILALGEDIRVHPELGFKEQRTAALVAERFAALGLAPQTGLALTGVKALLRGRGAGPTVAYLGELDSVLVADHPDADPRTGAAHACGHNAQIAALVALAYGLVESGAMAELDGAIALLAVPAEEYVEVEYRMGLREQGVIVFLGGKPELIRVGAFDDVQMALSTHLTSEDGPGRLGVWGRATAVWSSASAIWAVRRTPGPSRTRASMRSRRPCWGCRASTLTARRSRMRTTSACTPSSPRAARW